MYKVKALLQRAFRVKFVRFSLTVLFTVFGVTLVWHTYVSVKEWRFFNEHYLSLRDRFSSKVCEIPMENPFDKTVLPYIKHKKPLECKIFQPELTYMDYNGTLILNRSAIEYHNLNSSLLICYYKTLTRREGGDDDVIYDKEQVLTGSVKLAEGREFVSVRCEYDGVITYNNHHWYVPKKHLGKKVDGDIPKPQVFILVIESLSRLNAIRQIPKTYSYLTKVMKSEVLRGLTKVADNSFVNMVPFLTGRKVYADVAELSGNEREGPFDKWPLLWKNFSKAGYVTALTEDMPKSTIFNYLANGFRKQPTDYYPRPLWLSLFKSTLLKSSSKFCLGNVTTYRILFNWIKEFAIKYSKVIYFLFSFYIAISHDDFNDAQYLDSDMLELLRELNEKGHFSHAIVIVMGDHGNRFGNFLSTKIGRIEARMPLFSISIPPFLEERYPHLRQYLKLNSDRLTTWFDTHSLLMDVATSTYHVDEAKHVWNTRGYSPWRMLIPKMRTCDDAGVQDNYCICRKEIEMEKNDSRIVEASNELVGHLNSLLEAEKTSCVELSLGKVLGAFAWLPMERIAQKEGYSIEVRIQVSLKPSDGVVEAVLAKTAWSSKFGVVGDVNRLNRYGNQSACIRHKVLRKFCYCKNQQVSIINTGVDKAV